MRWWMELSEGMKMLTRMSESALKLANVESENDKIFLSNFVRGFHRITINHGTNCWWENAKIFSFWVHPILPSHLQLLPSLNVLNIKLINYPKKNIINVLCMRNFFLRLNVPLKKSDRGNKREKWILTSSDAVRPPSLT